jgi:YbgC/YbaW family acyl-CoA thioester hydrolase
MKKEMRVRITVRSYEIDLLGHVNNSVYLNYLEHARVEYLRIAGVPFESFFIEGIYPLVANVNINYKKPALVNDTLEIVGRFVKVGRTSVTIEMNIYRIETDELICESTSTYVFVDGKKNKPTSIPKRFLQAFSIY